MKEEEGRETRGGERRQNDDCGCHDAVLLEGGAYSRESVNEPKDTTGGCKKKGKTI